MRKNKIHFWVVLFLITSVVSSNARGLMGVAKAFSHTTEKASKALAKSEPIESSELRFEPSTDCVVPFFNILIGTNISFEFDYHNTLIVKSIGVYVQKHIYRDRFYKILFRYIVAANAP